MDEDKGELSRWTCSLRKERRDKKEKGPRHVYIFWLFFYAARSICFIKERKKKKKTPGR